MARFAPWVAPADLLRALRRMRRAGWHWSGNCQCKYINVWIDMRDGGCILSDRDKNRIGLEQLEWQYSEAMPEPPAYIEPPSPLAARQGRGEGQ